MSKNNRHVQLNDYKLNNYMSKNQKTYKQDVKKLSKIKQYYHRLVNIVFIILLYITISIR